MLVKVLVENEKSRSCYSDVKPVHGLSNYIESNGLKILFDVGPGRNFLHNAEKLGVDIDEIDIVIISHGHKDHGGGLCHFLRRNRRAKVYVHRNAFEPYYTKMGGVLPIYIGLDKSLVKRFASRIEFVDDFKSLSDKIFLLSNINGVFEKPSVNSNLLKKVDGKLTPDDFSHEMVLIVEDKGEMVLFTACSHSGVLNMIGSYKNLSDSSKRLKAVFGGFHLYSPMRKISCSDEYIESLAEGLNNIDTVYYTGHCTGVKNFNKMKRTLGERLLPMRCGAEIEI